MVEVAAGAKAAVEEKSAGDRTPLWWGLAVATVILAVALAYKIVKSDGQIDFQGGVDGIQVKITQAQQTIASAQKEVSDAQQQLNDRETALKAREQALQEREAKVEELLASVDKTTPAPRAMTPQQAQAELKKLRATPPVAANAVAPEPIAVKARLEKLDQLRATLGKTSTDLKAAAAAKR